MKTNIRVFSLLVFLALANVAHGQKTVDTKDLPNFYQVNANLYRGAQPTREGIRKLAQMGVKTIIDLRDDDDRAKTEESWARDAGIKFIDVDLSNWNKPSKADIELILKNIETAENQPVFVHCKRGADRTGTVIAAYRISHDGWTDKEAEKEAKKFGFGWWQFPMKDFIGDYYKDFKKSK